MAHLILIITVIALLAFSSQAAKGNVGYVNIQDTPIQVRTARTFEPMRYATTDYTLRPVTIVAQEFVVFRESHHNTPYPAIVILNKRNYNRSMHFDISVFDIRNIAEKTWQPFPQEINLEQLLGRACSGLRWPPTATVSPSKQHIVLYGFGTGRCADKLVIYGDRRSRVITTTGGHATMGAALATMSVGESDNSTFDLFAFGGAECLNGSNSSCKRLTNSLRRLRIVSSEACMNCSSWHKWELVGMSIQTRVPSPRVLAQLFADGDSLLLFGGAIPSSSGDPRMAEMLPDIWRFSLVAGQWVQLESNLTITNSSGVYPLYHYNTPQAAFISEGGTMVVAHGVSLHLCSVSSLRAHCTRYEYDLLGQDRRKYYPAAGQSSFYLIGSDHRVNKFFNIEVYNSYTGGAKKIGGKTSPLIEQDLDARCPAFQGHLDTPAIFIPHDDPDRHQYLFFAKAYDSSQKIWLAKNRKPMMSIWSLQYVNRFETQTSRYNYMYFHTFSSPAPMDCSSVTYLTPSMALLHERPARIWCLSIPSYSWSLATTSSNHLPPERYYHVAYKHRPMGMVLYGGVDEDDVPLGDLWLFQLHGQADSNCTGSWHNLTPYVIDGDLPTRSYHSVTEYGDDVIIFGGYEDIYSEENLGKSTMFMLQIKSNTRVIVRNIEIVPEIRSRFYHTLSWYTSADLLLLGGEQYAHAGEWATFADDALLMTLREENNTIVAKWNVFFKFRIYNQAILHNRIFSGYDSTRAKTHQFYEIENTHQCPKGHQRDRSNSCRPCPIGYYSSTIEQQCEKCANLTTTTREGSIGCELRNPCTAGYCHGHGKCFVDKADYKPFCTCLFGYLPSDQCKVPSVYLALMAAVVFTATATILVIALYQFVRKRRALNATEIQLGNTNRDLQRHQKKLLQINRGTLVRWTNLTIRKQLASGTYSKVLLAELGDMTVAVKQFPSYFSTTSLSSPFDVFIQEAEILRGLRHPNIVMFLGAGKDASSGCPFLVMEYLRRGSLHDVLHDLSNPIEHCDRLRFALDAARGLKYLHSSSPPQIHRDIKSPNLLVSDKWVVKVGDLETARFLATYQSNNKHGDDNKTERPTQLGDTSGRTPQHSVSYNSEVHQLTTPLLANVPPSGNTAGEVNVTSRVGMTCGAGTDRWRSPESIKKNLYTEKHDVYSFGVVLWEIFTRQTPYSDVTCSEDIFDEIVNERKPIFPPSAPYAYRHLAEQCMKTDAVDRPTIQRVVRELIEQFETL